MSSCCRLVPTKPKANFIFQSMIKPGLLTFRQFSFASSGRFGLLTPDGGPSTADPADDRHGVIVPSCLQGIPVRDEWQPAVLSLQGHLKCHESLQVHVTVEVRMTGDVRAFQRLIWSTLTLHAAPQTYTVLLSCRMSLLENSLRMSKNAKLSGGLPSPCGLGSLKANSIPSLKAVHRK